MSTEREVEVTVSAAQVALLQEAVASGEYGSMSDALADALEAWARRHEDRAEALLWVKAKIRASLADPDPDLSMDEVEQRLKLMFEHADRRADEAA